GKVILATDPDREGEAIAWHLKTVLKLQDNYLRVRFYEITKVGVKEGFDKPTKLNMKEVAAQETRRILDRIIGYIGTPAFSMICHERQIAGRVQTTIVVYLEALERAIRNFRTTLHFGVTVYFDSWEATWDTSNFISKDVPFVLDRTVADKVSALKEFKVVSFEEKPEKKAPDAPFTTSTYLRAAQIQFKLKSKKAMAVAQKLFEEGHITYMRTDSKNLSDDAIAKIRDFAALHNLPLPDKPRKFSKSNASAQEAHEAIRPTDISVSRVSEDPVEQGIYQMIWLRAVASQLADATYLARISRLKALELVDNREVFINARGRKLIDKGWIR
ncbi:DNA topoisomerase, partial [Acinetobacter baumannii]|nr:DNA topoisomerase [Acinetobacter baumannii]